MADRAHEDGRPIWDIAPPPGGWMTPWPQCIELVKAVGPQHWTLVGGLMVQLHSARAGLAVARPTADVDVVVHIETGHTTVNDVATALLTLGYEFQPPSDRDSSAHRFVRGEKQEEQVDVMVADHVSPRVERRLFGRNAFELPAGTQALRRTVYAEIGDGVLVSIPNVLGALVLKGEAYRSDSRDRRRHLDDAVVLAACVAAPLAMRAQMAGSDRSRVQRLHGALESPAHESWTLLDAADQTRARDALRILSANPQPQRIPRIGS